MAKQGVIVLSEDTAAADQYSSIAGARPRRGIKTSRQMLEQQILALLNEQSEMSISELHRTLLASSGVSYSMIQLAVGGLVEGGRLGKVASWPRRYYVIAGADAVEAQRGSLPH